MKAIFMSLLAVLACTHALAKTEKLQKLTTREPAANWLKELSPDSARVLNVLYTSCPEKLGEAMKDANSIGKVYYGEKNLSSGTQWMWQITTVRRTPMPFMSEAPVATLVIDWQSKKEEGPAAPDRGSEWEIKCSVQKAN